MKKNKEKKSNFKISMQGTELGLDFECNYYSEDLQKGIDQWTKLKKRVIIKSNHSYFFQFWADMYNQDAFIWPDKHSFRGLSHFIYEHFEVRQTKNPDEEMGPGTIYQYLNNCKGLD